MREPIPRGSLEYVSAIVQLVDSTDVATLLTMPVSLAITNLLGNGAYTWLPAEWVGAITNPRRCRTVDPVAFDATYPSTKYIVLVKLTDAPEAPIINAGRLEIEG